MTSDDRRPSYITGARRRNHDPMLCGRPVLYPFLDHADWPIIIIGEEYPQVLTVRKPSHIDAVFSPTPVIIFTMKATNYVHVHVHVLLSTVIATSCIFKHANS